MPKLSVIIPIYNTALPDLKLCLDSVAKIESGNVSYEVLLIDDGSKSAVGDFCKEYCSSHQSFYYHYQKNAGVSVARNTGLNLSKGDFVTFVDSDDIVDVSAWIETLAVEADLVLFDMQVINVSQKSDNSIHWPALENRESGYIDYEEVADRLIRSSAISGCCAKIIRRTLLEGNSIRFVQGMITGEDMYFVGRMLLTKPKMYYLHKTAYCYKREMFNAELRSKNHPVTILRDGDRLAALEMELIAEMSGNEDLRVELQTEIHNGIVCGTGRWICTQVTYGQFTDEKKELAVERLGKYPIRFSELSRKNKIFYRLITHKVWVAFSVIAKMRAVYLKRIKKQVNA